MASEMTMLDKVFDIILVDLLLKPYLEPRSVFALRRVSKDVKRLADTPKVWQEFIRLWGGRPTTTPWENKDLASDFEVFRDLVFLERHVPLVPPVQSILANQYNCTVTRLVFRRDSVLVEFSVDGDMALDILKEPSDAGLYLTLPTGIGLAITRSRPSLCLLAANDNERTCAGFLCFPYSFISMVGCRLVFRYGHDAGYSPMQLPLLDRNFCKKHHLEHFQKVPL